MSKSLFFVIVLIYSLSSNTCRLTKSQSYDKLFEALTAANKAAGLDDNKIYEVVSQISNSLTEGYDEYRTLAISYLSNCRSGDELMKGLIFNIKHDISTIESNIFQSKMQIDKAKDELKMYETELKKSRTDQSTLEKRIDDTITEYTTNMKEAQEKLDTIQVLQQMINDELLALNMKNKKNVNFVQLKDCPDKVEQFKNTLTTKLKDFQYIENTILATMITMAQANQFADKPLLYKLVNLLQKLEYSLQNFITKIEVDHKLLVQNLKDLVKNKIINVRDLEEMISRKNSQVIEYTQIIYFAKTDKEVNEKMLARKSEEFRHWVKICNQQKKFENSFTVWKDRIEKSFMKSIDNLDLSNN